MWHLHEVYSQMLEPGLNVALAADLSPALFGV